MAEEQRQRRRARPSPRGPRRMRRCRTSSRASHSGRSTGRASRPTPLPRSPAERRQGEQTKIPWHEPEHPVVEREEDREPGARDSPKRVAACGPRDPGPRCADPAPGRPAGCAPAPAPGLRLAPRSWSGGRLLAAASRRARRRPAGPDSVGMTEPLAIAILGTFKKPTIPFSTQYRTRIVSRLQPKNSTPTNGIGWR